MVLALIAACTEAAEDIGVADGRTPLCLAVENNHGTAVVLALVDAWSVLLKIKLFILVLELC